MAGHNETGKKGEAIAAEYLQNRGYQILEQNWRARHLEIDIIATKNSELVIVEVKCRTGTPLLKPSTAVTRTKQNQLIKAASTYIQQNSIDMEVHFDVISITLGQETVIEHIEKAFYPVLY